MSEQPYRDSGTNPLHIEISFDEESRRQPGQPEERCLRAAEELFEHVLRSPWINGEIIYTANDGRQLRIQRGLGTDEKPGLTNVRIETRKISNTTQADAPLGIDYDNSFEMILNSTDKKEPPYADGAIITCRSDSPTTSSPVSANLQIGSKGANAFHSSYDTLPIEDKEALISALSNQNALLGEAAMELHMSLSSICESVENMLRLLEKGGKVTSDGRGIHAEGWVDANGHLMLHTAPIRQPEGGEGMPDTEQLIMIRRPVDGRLIVGVDPEYASGVINIREAFTIQSERMHSPTVAGRAGDATTMETIRGIASLLQNITAAATPERRGRGLQETIQTLLERVGINRRPSSNG